MTLLDARSLDDGSAFTTEVCVCGAGATGITLALTLARRGVDVCLIEAGDVGPNEATQELHEVESVGYPLREGYMSRARYFGGSCNIWAGRNMSLLPHDIGYRDWVPYSGWPIDYEEVVRLYPEAARVLALPSAEQLRFESHEDALTDAERRILAEPSIVPTISIWGKKPRRFAKAYRGELERSGSVRVLLNANVTRLELDDAARQIVSVEIGTLAGKRHRIRARHTVLACGGMENARLLLLSRDRMACGIGNQHDQVGRYFMDHPRTVYGRVRLAAGAGVGLLAGMPLVDGKVQLGLALDPETQRREGLLNHYLTLEDEFSGYAADAYRKSIDVAKTALRRGHAGSRFAFIGKRARSGRGASPEGMIYLLTPKELMPHALYRARWWLRRRLERADRPSTRIVVYFCEQPPDPASRLTLSDATDALGLPRLRLDWRIGEEVTWNVRRLEQHLGRALEVTGLGRLEPGEGTPHYTDASHHMGTTRMSEDPRQGVVDRNCRVHGIDNLHMAGSSVFPSAGHANPTLTIVALSLRLAESLLDQLGS